jgi:thymidylate kinase
MTAFVFEGIDKVGKTTTLAYLHKLTGLPVMSVKRPAENGWEATKEWSRGKKDAQEIIQYARQKKDEIDFLLDRFAYSELVYSRAFDRPCDFHWYESILRKNRDVLKIVYVQENPYIIAERWKKDNQPTEYIVNIMAEYTSIFEILGLIEETDYIKFSPTQDNIQKIIDWIKKYGKDSVRSSDKLIFI